MRSAILLLSFFLVSITQANAQEIPEFELNVHMVGEEIPEVLYLAYHFGDKQYISDTLLLGFDNSFGMNKANVNKGVYMLVFPPYNDYVEVIVNEDKLDVTLDYSDMFETIQFDDSPENELFYNYMRDLADFRAEAEAVKADTLLNEEERTKALTVIDNDVKKMQQNYMAMMPHSAFTALTKANIEVPLVEAPEGLSGADSTNYIFYKYRDSFFDNISLSNEYLLYSPILHQKVWTYIDNLTTQDPDSLIAAIDFILNQTKEKDIVHQYFTSGILNRFASSEVVCFDRVYVHVAQKYYQKGEAPWVDDEQRKKILDNAKKLKPSLCGEVAADLLLKDALGMSHTLHEVEADHTVLFFYNCFCEEIENTLVKLAEIEKREGVRVVTVYVEEDEQTWKDKVITNELLGMINLNGHLSLGYISDNFNFGFVPKESRTYLLDQDKKILYKKISAEQVTQILDFEASKKTEE